MAGTVSELWRYPVKSLRGERVEAAQLDERGVAGDRLWAVTDGDGKLGSGKTSRRFRRLDGLFDLAARGVPPLVALPDGRELVVGDPQLDSFLRERYADETLTVAPESTVPHHDAAPLHLLTTASLRWLADRLPSSQIDGRRFRPNVLLDTPGSERSEDDWVGARFALGSAVLEITERAKRCVMTTNPQEELRADPAVLRAVTELSDTCLGVFARVAQPGVVRVGDALRPL